jgi:hypothetical protein
MSETTKTPRSYTESFHARAITAAEHTLEKVVPYTFSQTLERELDQCRKERDELLADVHQPELCDETISSLRKELEETRTVLNIAIVDVRDAGRKLADSESRNKELSEAALWLAKSCRDRLPWGQREKLDEELEKVEVLVKGEA